MGERTERRARRRNRIRRGTGIVSVLAAFAAPAAPASAADMRVGLAHERATVAACPGGVVLPGSDTCVKIGGFARFVATAIDKNWLGTTTYFADHIGVNGYSVDPAGVVPTLGFGQRDDTLAIYSEGRINVDALTRTDFGTVRAFIEMQAVDDETNSGSPFALRHAYVQAGNWLFGKTWSTYRFAAAEARTADPYHVVGDSTQSMRRNQLRFTKSVGGGLTVALALEDQKFSNPPAAIVGTGNTAPPLRPGGSDLQVVADDNAMPDVVATLNWEKKGVGSAQVSAALHHNRYAEQQNFGGAQTVIASDSNLGFALLAGLKLDLPTGDGDKVAILANYTDGASQYLLDIYGAGTTVVWGRCGATDCIMDGVEKWSLIASATHYWTKAWSVAFGAGYAETDYGAVGTALVGRAANPGVLKVATWEAFANVQWEPVPKTRFLVDVHYGHIDYRDFDLDPVTVGLQDAQGAWAGTFEVTRRF